MLENCVITAILPVVDIDRARVFYKDVLGLTEQGTSKNGERFYTTNAGASIALSPRQTPTKAEHTAISFEVKDIEKLIASLTERGVKFEEYDLPGLKTVDKVCVLGGEKAAWFKDTEGNILCIHENI